MIKTFISLSLLIAMTGLVACVKITDKHKDSPSMPTSDAWIEATATPNQFLVHLPPLTEAVEVRRQSELHPEAVATVTDLRADGAGLIDRHVNAGEKYKYIYVDANNQPLHSLEVDVPIDLVIDHAIELSQNPDWHNVYRVRFTKDGVLTTNGFNVILNARFLESDDGVLRTFSPGQTAPAGLVGRSGGDIKILAQEASGQLKIEMRGENGGPGKVAEATKSRDGGDGQRGGDSGNVVLNVGSVDQLKILFSNQPGLKGQGARGAPAGYVGGGFCAYPGKCMPASLMPAGRNGIDGEDGQLGQFCRYDGGRLRDCRQQ
jgi:hypothetical protein